MNRTAAKQLFWVIEFFRGEKVHAYLNDLERNQCLSREGLEELQQEKLRILLDYVVTHNSYYREKYRGKDVHGSFASLPILTKQELRDNFRNMVTDEAKTKLDLVETSGSTGVPLQLYRDRIIFGYNLAAMYRAHRWWGIDVGYKEAMLWGVPVSLKKRLKARMKDCLLNRFREKEYNIKPDTLRQFYEKIHRKRPDYIFGYSSMVFEFALYLKTRGLDLKKAALKAAICTAEKIYDYQRFLIEEVFGCRVVSEYGATETGIISYECGSGANHIFDDCVYVEIVDVNNNPLPDGESGKVLVTVLNSLNSPIIRYDLGDIASKATTPCACGLNFSVLGEIEGRTSDVVIGPNGEAFHSIIFYYIIKELTEKIGGVRQYKVCQKKVDELEFHIVRGDDFKEEADSFIRAQIEDKFGKAMKLTICHCDHIERSRSGKLRDFETNLDTSSLLSKIYFNSGR